MLRYIHKGKETTAGLGVYPKISLEEARGKAANARKLIADGIHPTTDRRVRKAQNVERGEATFRAIAEEWLARNKADWSPHHHERNKGLLDRILLPDLGALPVADITEPMLLTVLRRHYDAGIRESARRARGVASQVFAYAKDTHRATHNPARELAGSSVLKKPDVKHFAALKPEEVGPMLRALAGSGVDPVTQAALVLMLYTGIRDFALRGAKWQEIDLKRAAWTVPAERMKSGHEHKVPLPRQAVVILKTLDKQTRSGPDAFVFASHGKAGFLAENTLRLRLHGLGFKVTAHGFRSLITDLLNVRGFNADAIERQLDHANRDKVRASYLRTDFYDYRKAMMQWLADWADAQRDRAKAPTLPSNVIPLRRVA
jgi:integrase